MFVAETMAAQGDGNACVIRRQGHLEPRMENPGLKGLAQRSPRLAGRKRANAS